MAGTRDLGHEKDDGESEIVSRFTAVVFID
jgi:hypothetical protein